MSFWFKAQLFIELEVAVFVLFYERFDKNLQEERLRSAQISVKIEHLEDPFRAQETTLA